MTRLICFELMTSLFSVLSRYWQEYIESTHGARVLYSSNKIGVVWTGVHRVSTDGARVLYSSNKIGVVRTGVHRVVQREFGLVFSPHFVTTVLIYVWWEGETERMWSGIQSPFCPYCVNLCMMSVRYSERESAEFFWQRFQVKTYESEYDLDIRTEFYSSKLKTLTFYSKMIPMV